MKPLKFYRKFVTSDEYYLQPPINQLFYRFMGNMMSLFSIGDRQMWGYQSNTTIHKINSKIMTTAGPICVISQLVYLYLNFSDLSFDILGIIFSIFPATVLANVSILTSKFKTYKNISKNFLPKYHLYNIYKDSKSEFVKEKLISIEKKSRWTSAYLIFFFTLTWLGWITTSFINNYSNRELVLNHTVRLQTSLFLWMPFDYSYNYRNWCIVHLINIYTVLCGVCCIMIFQSINYVFVYNLIGHLYVLKHSLRTDFSGDMGEEEVFEKLKKISKHHSFIIQVFKDIQTAFGFNVSANYLQNLFGNSILMYQLTYGKKENMVLYMLMIIAYTGGPILMSFVLEEIRRQADDLPDVVYSIPWEKMSVSNQKIVLLILKRSQDVIHFTAFGGIKAGVAPMMSILKATFSYYVMLESTISIS